ncbi:MAG: hypothetical protein EOO62_27275 [Hymenobacter sp.]|nr:MAG: hypothetical protein EOO62_27275 [Hymenobacter sp.]
MIRTLLVGLLALAALSQAQGHNGRAEEAAGASASKSQLAPGTRSLPTSHVLFAQDTSKLGSGRSLHSAQVTFASAHLPGSLRPPGAPEAVEPSSATEAPEFDPETADISAALAITLRRPAAPLGRRNYRTRLVRTGHWASRREAVEILTCTYAGPLVLALLPATDATPSQVLAGPGYDLNTPLRPLELTQAAVLRLCGDRAPQVQAYAMLYNLHYQQATEVARLLDYYNRIAVVVK